jgi:hypothetical protein
MNASGLKSAIFAIVICLTFSAVAGADVVIVESRSGGQNFARYLEDTVGFPNAWQSSAAKSTAPGVTSGIGSRFNTSTAIGGSLTWFQVFPLLDVAGGPYRLEVTTTSLSGMLAGIVSTVTVANGTLTGNDIDTSRPGFQTGAFSSPHDTWNLVGTLMLSPGSNQPTVRFDETANTNRFYADAVRFTLIPEPACLGLLPLLTPIALRRRPHRKKTICN